jgi:hypothetical protein
MAGIGAVGCGGRIQVVILKLSAGRTGVWAPTGDV